MPTRNSYDYAILRVVPRVERQEFVNAGVILFCLASNFLDARIHADPVRLKALCPDIDLDALCRHLEAVREICSGGEASGPIGKLSRRERFHWLTAPRSTILQVSPVHSGLCEAPESTLESLFERLVLLPA